MIRAVTAATVLMLAGIAGAVSYRHALAVVHSHGETGLTGYLSPLTVDGLVLVAALVSLDAARHGDPHPALAKLALALGITATVAVNLLHGITHGLLGALIAGWPAVALVLAVELSTGMIRRTRTRTRPDGTSPPVPAAPVPVSGPAVPVPVPAPVRGAVPAPELARAVTVFAADLQRRKVPSVRQIKAAMRVGQNRARQIQDYLSGLAKEPAGAGQGQEDPAT